MRRFHVPNLPGAGERCRLATTTAHHVRRVLRLRHGDRVQVFDGEGKQATAHLDLSDDDVVHVILDEAPTACSPAQQAHLLMALVKPKALDLALRMGTEVGLTHLHIFTAQRSQKRPPRLDRWQRVVNDAARQCGRADTPTLTAPANLSDALQALPPGMPCYVALPGASRCAPATGASAALVGPEGGFTPQEVDLALAHGCLPLGLGSWVLRADTAATLAAHHICP